LRPVELDNTQPYQLAEAATQATDEAPFESQLLTIGAEAELTLPTPGSKAATVATTEDGGGSDGETYGELYTDDEDGIDWGRIPRFAKPHRMLGTRQVWIYRHGYPVYDLKTMKKIFRLCKYCH
jgi:hypothetical protein